MNIFAFLSLISTISIFGLGFYVLREKKNKLNKLFFNLILCLSFWNIMVLASYFIKEKEIYVVFHDFFCIGIYFIPACLFHFIIYFCKVQNKKLNRFLLFIGYFLFGFMYFMILKTPNDFVYVEFLKKWMPLSTNVIKSFFFACIFFALYAIYLLWTKYKKKSSSLEKVQIKYFSLGAIFFIFFGLTQFPNVFWMTQIPPLGNVGCIFFILCIAYSLKKNRLINIDVIISKIIIYCILVVFIFLFNVVFMKYVPLIIGYKLAKLFFIPTGISILFFSPLMSQITKIINKIIFRNKYLYQKTLYNIIKKLEDINNLNELTKYVLVSVVEAIGIKKASIFLEKKLKFFSIYICFGISEEIKNNYFLNSNDGIVIWEKEKNDIFIKDEQEQILSENEFNLIYSDLEKIGAYVIIPLFNKKNLIGLFTIDSKKSGSIYDQKDIEIFKILSHQLSNSIEKAKLYNMSIIDGLTGLYNHQYFMFCLKKEVKQAQRYKQPLSLILMDIDFFKKVNDAYGHLVGDIVLKRLGEIIKQSTRETDIQARYGGEEFCVLFTQTPIEKAKIIANNLYNMIKYEEFSIEQLKDVVKEKNEVLPTILKITISMGITGLSEEGEWKNNDFQLKEEILFKIADYALYQAKEKGRDQIEVIEYMHSL
ncbi:MAG: diguanylate cyclase [bacterium]